MCKPSNQYWDDNVCIALYKLVAKKFANDFSYKLFPLLQSSDHLLSFG